MKRNFIIGIAMMVAAFFIGTEIAQAADFSVSGHMRTRYEGQDHLAFDVNQDKEDEISTRVRINAKTNINSNTSAHLQFQHVKVWGDATANQSSYQGSDTDGGVGLHQAYFTLKNFAGLPVTAKVGRQQIVIDGHRLFGHTGWTSGAQTHDGIRLTHSHGNQTTSYGYIIAREERANDDGDEDDVEVHFLHSNFQGVLGGAFSAIAVLHDDECGQLSGACGSPSTYWTLGGRQVGKLYGLDYRAEAYWQLGQAGGAAVRLPAATMGNVSGVAGATADLNVAGFAGPVAERNAYMFGVRVGKSFKNVAWKPKITLWYDYLSGNDDESVSEQEWAAFDTLYDTGHKFYGFMDLLTNAYGADTNYLGLQDIAVKLVLKPLPKWTLKADLHNFHTANSAGANPDVLTLTGICTATAINTAMDTNVGQPCRSGGTEIGSELDLTLVHKYDPNVTLAFGYSQFMSEALWHSLAGSGNRDTGGHENTAEWVYVQAMVKF